MSDTTNTIILSRPNALWLADVGLSAASTDDLTPVICGAQIKVEGGSARVTCTDRYRVHTGVVELGTRDEAHPEVADHEFVMPLDALRWLKKNVAFHGRFMIDMQRVVITTTANADPEKAGILTMSVQASSLPDAAAASWKGELRTGNFPPVYRLIEAARDAEPAPGLANLRLDFFANASKLAGPHAATLVKFTPTKKPNVPGPVYLEFRKWGDSKEPVMAEALIQPNLMLR